MPNNLVTKLQNIGNAIRSKTGGTTALSLDAMPSEIESINTGETEEQRFLTDYQSFIEYNDYSNPRTYSFSYPNIRIIPPLSYNSAEWYTTPSTDATWLNGGFTSQNAHIINRLNFPSLKVIPPGGFNAINKITSSFTSDFSNVEYIGTGSFASFNYNTRISGITLSFPKATRIDGEAFNQAYIDNLYFGNLSQNQMTGALNSSVLLSKSWDPIVIFGGGNIKRIWTSGKFTEVGTTSTTTSFFRNATTLIAWVLDTPTVPALNTYITQYSHNNSSNRFYNGSAKIYVPKAQLSTYASATNWSVYYAAGNILAIEDSASDLQGIWDELDEKYGW